MILCKVVGTVISQEKVAELVGKKLLLCEGLGSKTGQRIVAVDLVGAGVGSEVLVSHINCGGQMERIDDWIVSIVDSISE